jgi:DNA mismatch repair protein MutL
MTSSIHILPEILSNKIAAGEVVQRPSSVVKELVENALDAKATQIHVHIIDGGKSLIQVIDNGIGMNGTEIDLCVQRHATSKIKEASDLYHLKTMGFRGEALPSIGSVSMMEIVSKPTDEEGAYRLSIEAGNKGAVEPFAWTVGTRVSIKNLFFNVPARLKFLKGHRTELNHIIGILKPLALINPSISFKLSTEQKTIFDFRQGDLKNRLIEAFGQDYEKHLIEVNQSFGHIGINGFIGNLDVVRPGRGEQYIFVNERPISDRLLNNAVFQAYKSLIQRGEYPLYVLNVTIPPQDVDVNVHPTKMEVKFKDEWRVYYAVKEAVETGIRQTDKMLPGFESRPSAQNFFNTPTASPQFEQSNTLFQSSPAQTQNWIPESGDNRSDEDRKLLEKARQFSSVLEKRPLTTKSFPQREQTGFIWQVHNKYILTQINSGIAIIDQHVAHERILFEKALNHFNEHKGPSQLLLFPKSIEFSHDDFNLLLDVLPMVQNLGFELREFGPRTIMVEAVPVDMRSGNEADILKEMLDYYRTNRTFEYSVPKRIAASYACKAAIKAGDPLTEEEMRVLVDRLFACEHPFFCPHGRPIIINLTIDELDKRFERH